MKTITRTGIVIGGHYIPKPPTPGKCAVEIQRALLLKERNDRDDKVIIYGGLAVLAALIVILTIF